MNGLLIMQHVQQCILKHQERAQARINGKPKNNDSSDNNDSNDDNNNNKVTGRAVASGRGGGGL